MTVEPHALVRQNYRLWLDDLARWQKDVAAWQQELVGSLAGLGRAAAALEDHRKALDSYTDQLLGAQAFLREYQTATVGAEVGEPLAEGVPPGGAIAEWVDRHPQLWDAHERIKRHHHAVVATTTLLAKAIAEAM